MISSQQWFFCITDYLTNLHQVDTSVMIRNDRGVWTTNWQGELPGFTGPVWYDPGGIGDIISLKWAKRFYIIEYHSENGEVFVVTHQKMGQH